MAQIESKIVTYDDNGIVSKEIIMIEEPLSLDKRIEQKELELVKMYNALQELIALKGE
jgi:hypothetical protein